MEQTRDRITSFVTSLPVAHRVLIVTAAGVFLMLTVLFSRWVTTPSYTVLYSGLADGDVAEVVDTLEAAGVPYQLEAGGSTVMVPRDQLYATRADLAQSGVSGTVEPEGWELLDSQGLSVSDFRQRVDYQRALEGELGKTLAAMDGVEAATVRLVLPADELFTEDEKPASASVLVTTRRDLSVEEVETITFLVASGVEGLETDQITVADADGTTLHAPGDGSMGQTTNRNLRQTREFEAALAGDVERLLGAAGGGQASVVVRATLDFDERDRETQTYDPASQVELRGQRNTEEYSGTGAAPGGVVGVDGGPLPDGTTESDYTREETLSEYGVDTVTEKVRAAPGRVEEMSVAIVMDDGSATGAVVPSVAEVERLVTSALGLQAERGDTIAVTPVPFPTPEEDAAAEAASMSLTEMLTLVAALLVFVIVAVGLLLMTRRGRKPAAVDAEEVEWEPVQELAGAHAGVAPQPARAREPNTTLNADVRELVTQQPDEIAALLRSWLADRRA